MYRKNDGYGGIKLKDVYELNLANNTASFVKLVIPYGSNNREKEGDKYKTKGLDTPYIADDLIGKIITELKEEIGFRPLKNLKDVMCMAKKAIKYGAGNCDNQSSIAFVFLIPFSKTLATSSNLWFSRY